MVIPKDAIPIMEYGTTVIWRVYVNVDGKILFENLTHNSFSDSFSGEFYNILYLFDRVNCNSIIKWLI